MVKLSVIVPVYNVEKYIDRCIESILNQTFQDFELLLINDGSTDCSLEYMKKYEKDSRVRIFSQKNKGPALTRNFGIQKSVGKYITFIDSDDYIDPNYFEDYYQSISKHDFDIVVGGYQRVVGDKVTYRVKLKQGEFSKYIVTGTVCRIIKRQFLIKNKIEFLDTNSSEDVYFNVMIYNRTNKIGIIDNVGYYYYYNSNSLSNTMHKGLNENIKIIELLNLINVEESYNLELNQYYIIRYVIWYLLYSGRSANSKEFMREYYKLFGWLNENILNYRNNKYLSYFKLKEEPLKYRFIINTFMLISKVKLVGVFSKIYCKGGSHGQD